MNCKHDHPLADAVLLCLEQAEAKIRDLELLLKNENENYRRCNEALDVERARAERYRRRAFAMLRIARSLRQRMDGYIALACANVIRVLD